MRYVQLSFWTVITKIDLGAKIRAEKAMGKDVFYHWNGRPLIMRPRIPRRGVDY